MNEQQTRQSTNPQVPIEDLRQELSSLQSERDLLRAAIDGTTDAVFVKDCQGRYLLANAAAGAILGKSQQEILGLDETTLLPAEFAEPIRERERRVMKSGQPETAEEVRTVSNENRTYLTTYSPYRSAQGNVIGITGYARDITPRKQFQQELAESESRLRAILEAETACVKFLGPECNVQYLNAAGLRIIEADSLSQVAGQSLLPLVKSRDRQAIAELADRALHGESGTMEYEITSLRGTDYWLEIHMVPYRDADGSISAALGITRDITLRMNALEKLRASEERFATVFRASPIGICLVALEEGTFLDANQAFLDILGCQREDVLGRTTVDLNAWVKPEDWQKLIRTLTDVGSVKNVEFDVRRRDGQTRHALLSLERMKFDGRDCLMATVSDVTERQQIERSLRQSQDHYQILVNGAIEGIVLHQDLIIQFANPSAARIFGFNDPEEMMGLDALDALVAPDDRPLLRERSESLGQGQALSIITGWKANRPDGAVARIQSCGSRVLWNGRPAILGFYVDVTEMVAADEALRRSREHLEILSRQLIATQETERRHLARELHDEIGQSLTFIKLQLNKMQPPAPASHLTSVIKETTAIVDQTIKQVRNLALELRPSILDDIGLAAAVRWNLNRVADQAGIIPVFDASIVESRISPEIATACFRVAQECLTNIARHANARHVQVLLSDDQAELKLIIHDDGHGFDVTSASERAACGGSFGLLGMQERTLLLRGQFEITSAPSEGTTVVARFPLADSPQAKLDGPGSSP